MKRLKIIWILSGALALIATGFYREFFFVNINEQMRFLWYGNKVSMMSDSLSMLDSLDYWTLYYLKWAMTIVFSGIFLIESVIFAKVVIGKTLWKELIFIYIILLFASGLVLAGYALFDEHETGYLISRYFMGIAQSPIPLMILLPAIGLRNRLIVSQ